MNIALFASAFHPSLGGVEELCRQLSLELIRQQHNVIILTNRWPRNLPKFETIDGIPVYRLPFRLPEGSAKATVNYHLTHRRIERDMLAILRNHSIGLLNVHCVSSNAHYAMIAQDRLKLPLVVTLHGELTGDANRLFEKSSRARRILELALNNAEAVTACSMNTLKEAESFYGKPLANKSKVIFNGVSIIELDRASPYKHPKPFILGAARLVSQKGFDVLFRAYRLSQVKSHDLLIAGDGPERSQLEQLVPELGLSGRVHFLGGVSHSHVCTLFRGCDVFVLPSRKAEALGIVNLEAMAAGKPVIASRIGGIPELVLDGKTGVLVGSENVDDLAMAIQTLCGDAELRQRLGSAGRERANSFAWPEIAAQYLKAYQTAGQL